MSQDLPVTSYALLGLLTFGDELTGYELKQRADFTLRFYWVSPAMSQVYSELARLTAAGLVRRRGVGRGTTYTISATPPTGIGYVNTTFNGTSPIVQDSETIIEFQNHIPPAPTGLSAAYWRCAKNSTSLPMCVRSRSTRN